MMGRSIESFLSRIGLTYLRSGLAMGPLKSMATLEVAAGLKLVMTYVVRT